MAGDAKKLNDAKVFSFSLKLQLKLQPKNLSNQFTENMDHSKRSRNKQNYPELPFVLVSISVFFCCQLALRWSEDSLKHNAGAKGAPQ